VERDRHKNMARGCKKQNLCAELPSSIKQSLLNLPTAERVYLCVLQGIYYDTSIFVEFSVLFYNSIILKVHWKAQLITTKIYPKLTIYLQTTKIKRFRTQRL